MRPQLYSNTLSSFLFVLTCGVLACAPAGCGMSSSLFVAESDAPDALDVSNGRTPQDGGAGKDEDPDGGDKGGVGTGSGRDPVRQLPCGTGPGCDPSDLGGETCHTLGLGAGTLLCNTSTCTFETQLCQGLGELPPCGSGPGCDTTKLGGATCESLGMPAGVLTCDPVTCAYDTSGCIATTPGLLAGGLFGTGTTTDEDGGVAQFGGGLFGTAGGGGLFGTAGGGGGLFGTAGGGGGLFGTAGGGFGGVPGAAAEPARGP
jgi:hypothetical protein